MSGPASTIHSLEEMPGVGPHARAFMAADPQVAAAAVAVGAAKDPVFPAGPGWRDDELGQELRHLHGRLGASSRSLDQLDRLMTGQAGCVITGQQPGILGGALYCAYKLAGAVGLARRLSTPQRPVAAVYWCGTDDSDFEEARRGWLWSHSGSPLRVEAAWDLHETGAFVGDAPGEGIAATEEGALAAAGRSTAGGRLRELRQGLPGDLGDRTMAFYLRAFADAGLVVFDARIPRMRALARDLFQRYADQHEPLTAALHQRTGELEAAGLPVPLSAPAVRSGLFAVRDRVRHKLEADALKEALAAGEDLSPSVLLRPLVQDALLRPSVAVLGPSELAYHVQIAPLYAGLEVAAAHPAPRPHVVLWPRSVPRPADASSLQRLLLGGDDARELLGTLAIPSSWSQAARRARKEIERTLSAYKETLGEVAHGRALQKPLARVESEFDKIERAAAAAAREARAAEGGAWNWLPDWLSVRGVPQERALTAASGWWQLGEGFDAVLGDVAQAYAKAVTASRPTTFLTSFEDGEDSP